jgi:ribosomal-protein-serine acetyltransferase
VFSLDLGDGQSLRLYEEADVDEVQAVIEANREYLAPWMPWAPASTRDTTLEFIRKSLKQLADNDGLQAAITDSGLIVGGTGYHRIDWENRSTTIGYWIAEDAQRRGIVTRSTRALVDHAFQRWKLNRVEIRCGVENARSRAIPERLGFTQEGVLREAERIGDRYIDHVVYAMLARDWPKEKEPAPL